VTLCFLAVSERSISCTNIVAVAVVNFHKGCSNSLAPPNQIMGEEAKNVLVTPNVAQLNMNQDISLLSAIQYGVTYMNVTDIIVCGNYDAEGVRVATQVRNVYKRHQRELEAIPTLTERHHRLVNLDVVGVCLEIFKTGVVQKRRKESYEAGNLVLPRVHAMVFNPQTGDLKRIPVRVDVVVVVLVVALVVVVVWYGQNDVLVVSIPIRSLPLL
jgi:carbonic anhydrase